MYKRVHPLKIYSSLDIKLLEKTDELHLRLSEDATKEVLRRELETFNHTEYQTISRISYSHITTLDILQFTKVHGLIILRQDKYQ